MRQILAGKDSTVILLGDDRSWAEELFKAAPWAHVPPQRDRPTIDLAFASRYCQTVILTASASTFGFWLAYLSLDEDVYYNKEFAISDFLRAEFTEADVFLPSWTALVQNKETLIVTEEPRFL